MVTACAVVRIESINWLLRRSNFHNIRIIHNKRQTPPDRLLDKSTVSGTQEESRNKSIDASALLIGLRNCESWFEHRPGPPVNQQVYLTTSAVDMVIIVIELKLNLHEKRVRDLVPHQAKRILEKLEKDGEVDARFFLNGTTVYALREM